MDDLLPQPVARNCVFERQSTHALSRQCSDCVDYCGWYPWQPRFADAAQRGAALDHLHVDAGHEIRWKDGIAVEVARLRLTVDKYDFLKKRRP
jgi:hypothetical protein